MTFSKDPSIRNLPWDQKLFAGPDSGLTEGAFHQTFSWNIEKGAKVGKYNGLTLLLDAETFDYMYQVGDKWVKQSIKKDAALCLFNQYSRD